MKSPVQNNGLKQYQKQSDKKTREKSVGVSRTVTNVELQQDQTIVERN